MLFEFFNTMKVFFLRVPVQFLMTGVVIGPMKSCYHYYCLLVATSRPYLLQLIAIYRLQ